MVGFVIVSHSRKLAEGVVELAKMMAPDVPQVAAGGLEDGSFGTSFERILEAVNEQTLYPADELRAFFWDMFIADAFLGNFDRHNGNWGLLVNELSLIHI